MVKMVLMENMGKMDKTVKMDLMENMEKMVKTETAEITMGAASASYLAVPSCGGAFTSFKRVAFERGGRGWFLFHF